MRMMSDDAKNTSLSEPTADPVCLLVCTEDQNMHFISKVRTFHLVLTSSGGCWRVEMSKRNKMKEETTTRCVKSALDTHTLATSDYFSRL